MILPNKKPETVLELLENIKRILDGMIEEISAVIEKMEAGADPRREQPEQVEIQHVGYDADQLGRNK